MPKQLRKPAYQLHKASRQGKVRIDGRDHDPGTYGSAESRERSDELIREWLIRQDTTRCRLTVDDLVILYVDHAERCYSKPGGRRGARAVLKSVPELGSRAVPEDAV